VDRLQRQKRSNASLRAKVGHPFRVIKREFGLMKVRFRGLGQEHRARGHAVRAVERMDGATTVDRDGEGPSKQPSESASQQSLQLDGPNALTF
jgi:hypothetical protein